jgi:hypothetical protein
MTATIITAQQIAAARSRHSAAKGEGTAAGAKSALPPVSSNLVDSLFHTESDHRQEYRSLPRAA